MANFHYETPLGKIMSYPSHKTIRFALQLLLLLLGAISCKKNDDPAAAKNNKVDFSKTVTVMNNDPKKRVAFIMRVPEVKMDITTFGLKDENGILNKVTQMLFTNPVTEEWFLVDFEGNYPSKIALNNGTTVSFSNYNAKNATVDVVVKDINNKIVKSGIADKLDAGVIPTFDLVARKLANKGGRKAAIEGGEACAALKDAASFIGFLANAIGCAVGIATIEATLGVAAVLTGYGTAVSCYNAVSTLFKGIAGIDSPSCSGTDLANDALGSAVGITSKIVKDAEVVGSVAGIVGSVTDIIGCIPCEDDPNAKSTGDPHISTHDRNYYSFQGHGEFIAVKSTTDNFEIQARQEDPTNTGYATLNTAVAVRTGSDVLCVLANPVRVYLNKALLSNNFSSKTLSDGSKLSQVNDYTKLETPSGDLVIIRLLSDSYLLDYAVRLGESRRGKVKGLMGNFDGNFANDLALSNGQLIEDKFENLYPTYTDSWRITQANSLFFYDSGKNTATYTKRNFPVKPVVISDAQRQLATATCKNAGITAEPYLSNCIYDVAVTGDARLVNSSLWQQNYFSGTVTTNPVGSDVSYFQNVRLEITHQTQSDLTQLNLIDWKTGKVYALRDGAVNASKIDIAAISVAGHLALYPVSTLKNCGISCGVGSINTVLDSQKWATNRKGTVELKVLSKDETPANPDFIPLSKWATLKTAADLQTLHKPLNLDINESLNYALLVEAKNSDTPNTPFSNSVCRFITQEGKRGAYVVSGFGKIANTDKYWVTIDVKIEK